MVEKPTEIAPVSAWAALILATALLLGAFVAYAHAQLAWRAFGQRFEGPAAGGTLATMARWSVALLAAGVATFGILLGWPTLAIVLLGAAAAVPIGVDLVVRLLG